MYKFPNKIKSGDVKDFLDQNVDDKYYISEYFKNQIRNTKYKTNRYLEDTNNLINGKFNDFLIMDYRYDEGLRIRKNNLCPTLTTKGFGSISNVPIIYSNKKLRFITPKERWRLMGFEDEEYDKAAKVCSENQLYKQARKLNLCTSARKDF